MVRCGAQSEVFAPVNLGPVRLRNRIIKAATFEGMTRDNAVTDSLVEFHRAVAAGGVLDALQLTGGSSFENPMYLFRGEAPLVEMAAAFPAPLRAAFKVMGKQFLPEYPFEEAYFLPYARQFREALEMLLTLLGGINRAETIRHAVAEGFEYVAMARALLREPNLVIRMQEDDKAESLCIHCNKCMPTIYRGTHCVLVPPEQQPGMARSKPSAQSRGWQMRHASKP